MQICHPLGDVLFTALFTALSSLLAEAAAVIGASIRRHWEIENKCHHLPDVTFHEEHSQVRDRHCARNPTLVREITAEVLRDHPLKGLIRSKGKRAGLSARFCAEGIAPNLHNPHTYARVKQR